ncbi:MAG: hypothetical protein ACYCO9_16245 [Streptosporangiaceae bacterium]
MGGPVTEADGPCSDVARAPIAAFAHETSLSLLVLGGVFSASMTAWLVWPWYDRQAIVIGGVSGPLSDWVTAMGLTVAFAVLWLTLRRRVSRDEGRSAGGFVVGVLLGVVLTVTPFTALLVYGPFVLFGVGLFFGGYKLDDPVLILWAAAIGIAGFVVTVHPWNQPVIDLVLGLLTVIAGVIAYLWESRRLAGDAFVRSRLG